MKKLLINSFLIAAMACVSVTLCSCGDDNDNSAPNLTSNTSLITDANGDPVYLTSIYNVDEEEIDFVFTYDNTGRLSTLNGQTISWRENGFTFTFIDHDSESEKETYKYDVTLNNMGYISRLNFEGEEFDKEDNKAEKWNGTIDCQYNSDGNLTKITMVDVNVDKSNERSEYSGTCEYTWINGNMVSYNYTLFNPYPEGTYEEKETRIFSYGSKQNYSKQRSYIIAFCDDFLGDFAYAEWLVILGYFGKGPITLPNNYSYSGTWGDNNEYSGNYSLSYTQNANGTLKSETRTSTSGNTSTYEYGYGNVTRSVFVNQKSAKRQRRYNNHLSL